MSDSPKSKPASPEVLAHEIYEQAVRENGGDEREASVSVIRFLTEALVYSAGMSVGGDEERLRAVLGHIAGMIAKAPPHWIVVAVTAARDAKKETS